MRYCSGSNPSRAARNDAGCIVVQRPDHPIKAFFAGGKLRITRNCVPMNTNQIITDSWSNKSSEQLYAQKWPGEPAVQAACANGDQCGGCSFFAAFNSDWGLCANPKSRHHLETVFEHFTCPGFVAEGWGPHSFTDDRDLHCRCGGPSSEYWDKVAKFFEERKNPWPRIGSSTRGVDPSGTNSAAKEI